MYMHVYMYVLAGGGFSGLLSPRAPATRPDIQTRVSPLFPLRKTLRPPAQPAPPPPARGFKRAFPLCFPCWKPLRRKSRRDFRDFYFGSRAIGRLYMYMYRRMPAS